MKEVFLTGASGTIGSALVPLLLGEQRTGVTILLRAASDQDLQRRVSLLAGFWAMGDDDPRWRRFRAIRGDVCAPCFGLTSSDYTDLERRTTHIIHCAASVKLNLTMEQARDSAVVPTRGILDLAARCRSHGQLEKVDLVSTVGVWGRTPGIMPERALPEVHQFHNTYEAAKSEAESLVWNDTRGLPTTIHRPSMVIGDSGTGKVIHFQVFYHLCEFLSGRRTLGIVPGMGDTCLDVIPVDFVARAIHWANMRPEMAGKVLHLCSGPVKAIPLTELQAVVRERWQNEGMRLPRLTTVSPRILGRVLPILRFVAPERQRRAIGGLPQFLAYLGEAQGFANDRSTEILGTAGLEVPAVRSYLDPVFDFYHAKQGQSALA